MFYNPRTCRPRFTSSWVFITLWLGLILFASGCAKPGLKSKDLAQSQEALSVSALDSAAPSTRTQDYLRSAGKAGAWQNDPAAVLRELESSQSNASGQDKLFALMELAHLEAKLQARNPELAGRAHLSCVIYAYLYLYGLQKEPLSNLYNPYTSLAVKFYNRSLAEYLLLARAKGLRYSKGLRLETLSGEIELNQRTSQLTWISEDFSDYRLAYEYELKGFSQRNARAGLGVALALMRKPAAQEQSAPGAKFAPQVDQTFSATAFLRFAPAAPPCKLYQADLEIHDPMNSDTLSLGQASAPLEADFSAALAIMLANAPDPKGITGLTDPAALEPQQGLYMLEPYQPGKIPLVFVHGLMSSPQTWVEMLNGLLGDRTIRRNYQFWFFKYPTGNPVLYSASTLRESLLAARRAFDPLERDQAFERTVVVGHSMGGLLTKLMVQPGGDKLLKLFSDKSLAEMELSADQRALLERMLYFSPVPWVSRVVFIATPHRGSSLAVGVIGRLGRALVSLPAKLVLGSAALLKQMASLNSKSEPILKTLKSGGPTGIDSLSPDNPILAALCSEPFTVPYHSIIGDAKAAGRSGGSDGVVPYSSSHLEGAQSELVVLSGHNAQESPQAILELDRILVEHLHVDKN